MKNPALILSLLLFVFVNVFSQQVDTMAYKKHKFYLNGSVIKRSEVKTLLLSKPSAATEYKKSQVNYGVMTGCVGAGVIIASVGVMKNNQLIQQKSEDVENGIFKEYDHSGPILLMVTGLAIELIAIPFAISGKKHLKKIDKRV
jgi:hypothetical protein